MQGMVPSDDLAHPNPLEHDGTFFFGKAVYRRYVKTGIISGGVFGPRTGFRIVTIEGLGDLVDVQGAYNISTGHLHCAVFANQAGANSWHSGFYADPADGSVYWYGNQNATPDQINGPFELVIYYTRGRP